MNRALILHSAFCILHSALAAVPLKWTVETSRVQPVVFDAVRGETLALEASFKSYGTALAMPTDAAIFYQTNGMGTAWWTAPASVASNRVTATFTPAMDPGAATVTGFLGSTGQIYRAAFTLRFRNGPGASPNALPLPAQTIDCATVTFLNPDSAPWTGGGGSGGGVTTNDVCAIVTNDVGSVAVGSRFATPVVYEYSSESVDYAITNLAVRWNGEYWEMHVGGWADMQTYHDGWYKCATTNWNDGEPYSVVNSNLLTDAVTVWIGDKTATGFSQNIGDGLRTYANGTATYTNGTHNALGLAYERDVLPTVTKTVTKAYVEGLGIEAGVSASAVTNIAASASVTNAGAVAYADGTTNALAGVKADAKRMESLVCAIHTSDNDCPGLRCVELIYSNGVYGVCVVHNGSKTGTVAGTLIFNGEYQDCYYTSESGLELYIKYDGGSLMSWDMSAVYPYSYWSINYVWNYGISTERIPITLFHVDQEGEQTEETIYSDREPVGQINIFPTTANKAYKDDLGRVINETYMTSVDATNIVTSASITNGGAKAYADNTFAAKSTETDVANLSAYIRGDRVRLSVTNYYGNTSGELPRLRIEEFDHSETTTVDNVQYVTNFYHTVWDENDRHTNFEARIDAKTDTISNTVMTAAWKQTNLQLADKAPRAWQSVTSAGEAAPENTVWHTAPNTVFAGGTEYAHVAVGEGTICVLVDQGAPVFTEGAEGQFRFMDESGENYFGFDVRSAYTLGCRTDGISVDSSSHLVSLTYDLTSSINPTILHCTNLTENVWTTASVTWEQNPPTGTMICYIDCGTTPSGFYKAQIEYAGGAKFITNMQADLAGGIAATNEVLNVIQSITPVITSTGIVWKVMQ